MSGEIIIYIIKFLGVSAALWMIYLMLFKAKASFMVQRVFLLLIPLIAVLASMLSIDYIEIAKTDTIANIINTTQVISNNFAAESIASNTMQVVEKAPIVISFKEILCGIYVLVSLVMFVILFVGVRKINSFKKIATKQKLHDTTIYRCGLIEAPFSFWRSIFIDRKIDGEKFDLVVKHELAHINSLHFIDKIVVEIYLIMFWYNPFVWSMRREIGLVHEFESDSKVINENCDVKLYKKFLFEEAANNTPSIANGFNNSLIKQRFVQMKNNYKIRYKTARTLLTIPLIGCLMLLTSFTYIKEDVVSEKIVNSIDNIAEYITTKSDTILKNSKKNIVIVSDKEEGGESGKTTVIIDNTIKIESTDTKNIITIEKNESQPIEEILVKDIITIDTVRAGNSSVELPWYKHPMCYDLRSDQYFIYRHNSFVFRNKAWVYRRADHTQVDILCRISSDISWTIISSNFLLVDPETREEYRVRSIKNDIPFDKTLVIRGEKGKTVLFSLIFPPLREHIKNVDLVERVQPESFVPDGMRGSDGENNQWMIEKVKVLSEKIKSFNQ